MKFIKKEFSHTLEIKKSKFIAVLVPYQNFKSKMEQLKDLHPKGRHFVYAYRHLNEFDQVVENQSDDGEPKGSSGKPALNVLKGNEFINTAVIIVRYFGGTKLGIGGLVRAYGDSVNEVISVSSSYEYKKMKSHTFEVTYSDLKRVEYLLDQYEFATWKKMFEGNSVKICLNINEDLFDELESKLRAILNY